MSNNEKNDICWSVQFLFNVKLTKQVYVVSCVQALTFNGSDKVFSVYYLNKFYTSVAQCFLPALATEASFFQLHCDSLLRSKIENAMVEKI